MAMLNSLRNDLLNDLNNRLVKGQFGIGRQSFSPNLNDFSEKVVSTRLDFTSKVIESNTLKLIYVLPSITANDNLFTEFAILDSNNELKDYSNGFEIIKNQQQNISVTNLYEIVNGNNR